MPEVPRCAPETLSQLCFSKICILIKNNKWLLFFLSFFADPGGMWDLSSPTQDPT